MNEISVAHPWDGPVSLHLKYSPFSITHSPGLFKYLTFQLFQVNYHQRFHLRFVAGGCFFFGHLDAIQFSGE